MKEFWCSECGQECRWGDGGNTKPPGQILRGVTWRHVPQDRPASAA